MPFSARAARTLSILLCALSLVWVVAVITPQVYRPLILLVGILATFFYKPSTGRLGALIDAAWIAAALFGLVWPLAGGEAFLYRAATPGTGDVVAGCLTIVVILEAARRTTGLALPIVAVSFLGYAVAGPWFADIGLAGLAHRGYDLPRLIGNLYMTLEGIYGVPLDVAATYIILFSLYGAVLEQTGAGQFFVDFSMRLSGRARGAVAAGRSVTLASFLLGTVSGSGVATTVTVGSMGWPILRRVGFSPETAGAMLAAGGIGALLSPPTLGAAAFLIAEYLRVKYLDILVMATVPTVLYYLSILFMIERDAEAVASHTLEDASPGAEGTDAPPAPRGALAGYHHFISLVLVAALMAAGFSAFRAVFLSMLAAVVLSWFDRAHRMTPRRSIDALAGGGEDVLSVLSTTAVAGVIVGVTTLTGLGLKAAGLIVGLAGGSVALTVLFAAIAVWILGLAVPVTASYIIAAVMVAPALTGVGVAPVAAHMFIFYYAVLSEVSPPTALAPFAAAALTGGRPLITMLRTWKYSLPAFLVPFAFTLDPRGLGLLLQGTLVDNLLGPFTAAMGVYALARSASHAPVVTRATWAIAGLLLFYPAPMADVAGAALGVAAFVGSRGRDSLLLGQRSEGKGQR
jgi:TRAP transporter 4TM/12TM fusion protein